MISLQTKPNVLAPNATYPYGQIVDDDGSSNGTPVNVQVYGDIHQFFESLMADSGISPNNLPDNLSNGFQLLQAFEAAVRNKQATTSALGTARLSTNAQTITGTDAEIIVTPASLSARVATESVTGIAELATQAEVNAGADDARIVTALKLKTTPEVMGVDGSLKVRTKIIDIGDWDMNTNQTVTVSHGIADFTKIRSVKALIRTDDATNMYDIGLVAPGSGVVNGSVGAISSSSIVLLRTNGGSFDTTGFQATSYNRGFITIEYIA